MICWRPAALRAALVAATTLLCAATTSQATLLAFYDFEGNANDVSGNGNNGTVYNAALTLAGYEGQAYFFDGFEDYIDIPIDINYSVLPELTMGAWVNATSATAIRQVISHDDGGFDRSLGIDTRGGGGTSWSAFTGNGVVSSGLTAQASTWVFLAAVYDQAAASMTLYADDDVVTTSTYFGAGGSLTSIGRGPDFGEYFHGAIDNAFFYDEALTSEQIAEIRAGGAPVILGSPVPEPSSLVLVGTGLLGLAVRRRQRGTSSE